ncbi:glycoside hydrolase family 9 protein [Marinimicrobium sp. C6131]|uniref:glycoside hydrolase family 9 protein n=1 Tax=Marinimicrobium sp. C6131 TaxID=3022676 RepID=UPI00223D628E|nr:glycoside hydrolase family 9 protein [Marinimicrobium sp. C6131]UZJ44721.1 glycoside hydrolase family 9 protein [Marinimicrobium sp. C6131]
MHARQILFGLALSTALSGCGNSSDTPAPSQRGFELNDQGYFEQQGVGLMVFQDTSPESRQSGLILVSHDNRLASNGDLRLELTPGQWSPVPRLLNRTVDREKGEIVATLKYPDERQHRTGFNPLDYPDLELEYDLRVRAEGDDLRVQVDLKSPLPEEWAGKVGFQLELYPADLFGKSWIMDDATGIFPRQPYAVSVPADSTPNPKIVSDGERAGLLPLDHHRAQPAPLASGQTLTVAPESERMRLQIESLKGELQLLDGRVQHQNGWFTLRSPIEAGATTNAVSWRITPNVVDGWVREPVIQHSMVGYHPQQEKVAVIETDPDAPLGDPVRLLQLDANGAREVIAQTPTLWGDFLRYRYYQFDFSSVQEEGLYQLALGETRSHPFRIARNVYDQNVWQPTLEYFLPIQMGHMRVKEKYKLWHDDSHRDDALMAPTDINHFDGYVQGSSTLTDFAPGEHVPGLTRGGWYDAGDEDFRIESQSGEVFILSAAYDEFGIQHDNTLINQELRLTELREPDGLPDILQQIEHGLLTVVGGYEALGRLYRGIIVPTLTQYVMGGDFSGQTDNLIYDKTLGRQERTATHSGLPDDRWVFTEENPAREFDAIANIAASVGPMRGYDDDLAERTLAAAEDLWRVERAVESTAQRNEQIRAAVELFRTTGKPEYRSFLLNHRDHILDQFRQIGWAVARVVHELDDPALTDAMRNAAAEYHRELQQKMNATPYGLDFEMQLWGRGWTLQHEGVAQYFLHKAFPEAFGKEYLLNILHYVLGTNPGANAQSYATGVGAKSKRAAYGLNRMDYSYIPGGVIVGTALIQPDFPELKEFPYLWQQSEYVLGGGASNFMFLALAADRLLNAETAAD